VVAIQSGGQPFSEIEVVELAADIIVNRQAPAVKAPNASA
jgi:hypothetical protein